MKFKWPPNPVRICYIVPYLAELRRISHTGTDKLEFSKSSISGANTTYSIPPICSTPCPHNYVKAGDFIVKHYICRFTGHALNQHSYCIIISNS